MVDSLKSRMSSCVAVFALVNIFVVHAVTGLLSPSSAVTESYNLDYKLSWNPPPDVEDVEKVLYTVSYADTSSIFLDDSLWIPVPMCVNISRHACNVSVVLNDSRDFTTKMELRVEASEHQATSDPLQVTLYPDRHVHISAPTMHVTKVTETFLGVNLIGPESPYLDLMQREKYLRIEEVASNLKEQIYFLVKLEGFGVKMSRNTTAMYPYVEFNNLSPGLSYNISAITSYRGIIETTYSKKRTVLAVFTTLSEKLHRPIDVELREESAINCSHPDLRDVIVRWKRPHSAKPIIFYDLRSWIHGQKGNAASARIRSEVNRTNYSFLLHNLPRWSQIEVVIFANTTVAGCSSLKSVLFPHSVDDGSSKPENLSFITNSPNSGLIAWKPPSSCKECIIGYEVSWRLSVHATRNASKDIVPPNTLDYKLEENTVSTVTMVAVTTLLISGANMHKTGQQAVLGIQLEDPRNFSIFFIIFATCVGLLVISMMLLLIIFYKIKTKRRRKDDDPTINIILSTKKSGSELPLPRKPLTSSALHYSRSIYVREPEIFDELLPTPSK